MTDDNMALEVSLRAFWLCFSRQHGTCEHVKIQCKRGINGSEHRSFK